MLTLGLGWEGLALLQVGVTEKTGSQFSSEGESVVSSLGGPFPEKNICLLSFLSVFFVT